MIHSLAADVQAFTSNVFLVEGDRTALVDVGNDFDILGRIDDHVDAIDAVILTHTHPDHIGTLDTVLDAFDVDVWGYDPDHAAVDRELVDGATVAIGDGDYEIIHTPGHKNDHVCLYDPQEGVVFAGDLVFANGGFGRTDLAEGNRQQLIESITRLLDTVDDSLEELHPGHGPSVTTNPRQDIELALQAAKMR
jgi:glyoxylase-like metal-dependent hydrolase (beta-lactamase superfamily II)